MVPTLVVLWRRRRGAAAGAVQFVRGFGSRWSVLRGVVAVVFVFGFLAWAATGKSMSLIGILQLTVQRALPITFGALSGLLCERAGVVNIAIEGMLLAGAFTGAVVGGATGNDASGSSRPGPSARRLASLLAVLAIRYRWTRSSPGP